MLQPVSQDVLTQFSRRYRPALMSFFMRRIHDHSEAEDLTQEVFSRLAAKTTFEMQNSDAYIFQVAANLLRDRGRRNGVRGRFREMAALDALSERDDLDPARVLLGREALRDAAGALKELPSRTRAMFILFRLEHMSQTDIAQLYGISVSGVQKHLIKAMTHLVRRFGNGL